MIVHFHTRSFYPFIIIIFILSISNHAFNLVNFLSTSRTSVRSHCYTYTNKIIIKTAHTQKYFPRKLLLLKMSSSSTSAVIDFDDSEAKSQFGTKQYWDDMYKGQGDLSADEYSWYYRFDDTLQPIFKEYLPLPSATNTPKMLVPGVGNDNILVDLYNYGYHDITAFDYSSNAIQRQIDLLSYYNEELLNENITLLVRDGRCLDMDWSNTFDIIFEKGALDAVYLSGENTENVEKAVEELGRVIKPGGYFISVSGVVPEELRRKIFRESDWEWLRDGSDDKKAGCFIWRRVLFN